MLPPVSTEGLTAADIGDLASRIRQQMVETLREISDPNAPPAPDAPSEIIGISQTTQDVSVDTPPTQKESTPVPTPVPSTDVAEERPVTPHSEVTSEGSGSVRRSENETEEEEGMVMVGRPR